MQTTNTVLMVRPAAFMSNPETRASNAFQKSAGNLQDVQTRAQVAFDSYVQALRNVDIEVHVIDDAAEHGTPDSLFPNNWIAMLEDGTLYTFPMEAPNRRRERREDIILQLATDFVVNKRIDLSAHELEGRYLEGTGSLILDHDNRIAYSCRSSRSSTLVGQELSGFQGTVLSGLTRMTNIGNRFITPTSCSVWAVALPLSVWMPCLRCMSVGN